MSDYLSMEELETLRRWPTCAVSNAIELFNIRPRNEGFMLPEIKCVFPDLEPMIGYAVTGVISADSPEGRRIQPFDWWEEILKIPEPRVVVIHDIDDPFRAACLTAQPEDILHRRDGATGSRLPDAAYHVPGDVCSVRSCVSPEVVPNGVASLFVPTYGSIVIVRARVGYTA